MFYRFKKSKCSVPLPYPQPTCISVLPSVYRAGHGLYFYRHSHLTHPHQYSLLPYLTSPISSLPFFFLAGSTGHPSVSSSQMLGPCA
jgi:hypothetical protein